MHLIIWYTLDGAHLLIRSHSTRLASVWILVYPQVQLLSGLSHVCHIVLAGRSTDQATGCMWQLVSWYCMSDPCDTVAGHISSWLNPKSMSLSSCNMGGCMDVHFEELPLSKTRGKNYKHKTEWRTEEASKTFSRSSQVIWLCACSLLMFGNGSCLKSVNLIFEGVMLVVMFC